MAFTREKAKTVTSKRQLTCNGPLSRPQASERFAMGSRYYTTQAQLILAGLFVQNIAISTITLHDADQQSPLSSRLSTLSNVQKVHSGYINHYGSVKARPNWKSRFADLKRVVYLHWGHVAQAQYSRASSMRNMDACVTCRL